MAKMKFNKTKTKNQKRSTTLFALILCVVALSVGSWSAYKRTSELTNPPSTTEKTKVVEPARGNQTNIPIATMPTTQSTQQATTNVATTKAQNKVATFFTLPIGGEIIKEFDNKNLQFSDTFGDWRLHLGVDISAKNSAEVYASGNGQVQKVYEDPLLGGTVVINHGKGIVAYYSGVVSAFVKKGEIVEVGQTLGIIGDIPSEIVEAKHLHFAVKKDDVWVHPIKTLGIKIK